MNPILRSLAILFAAAPLSLPAQPAIERRPDPCQHFEEVQQPDLGSITGQVLVEKVFLPGATVTVSRRKLTKTVITDVDGRYEVRNLPPGVYRVDAELAGFKKSKHRSLIVDAGKNVTADFGLKVHPQEAITIVCPGLEYLPKPGTTVITREMMEYLPVD